MSIDVQLIDGDLPHYTRHVRGPSVTLQRLRIRLQTFLGEWLLDASAGLPYLEWIGQKPPRLNEIGAFVRREIETAPGVISVDGFSGTYDAATRRISFTADIVIEELDEVVTIEVLPTGTTGNTSPAVVFSSGRGPIVMGI